MKSASKHILVLAAIAASLLWTAGAAQAASKKSPDPDAVGAAYCKQTGGEVEERRPFYGTNGGDALRLAGQRKFCQYTLADDGSRIHVLIKTLYANKPSLAALAYYAQVQLQNCNGNPASCYCSQLGGTDLFGGVNAAGGGWVLKGAIDETLEACIFPDMSSIDSWGLAYHSAGIIRGIDLSTVLRYKNPNK